VTTHARRQIREAAATLVTGLSTTGTNVRQSRMHPAQDAGLPLLLVTTNDEIIVPGSISVLQERDVELLITGFAKSASTLDDTLDAIALEVETAMATAPTLGGKCSGMELRSIKVDFDDETDKPVGRIALDYRITYFVNAGAPGTIL
jgi:hypothetical protein